MPRVSKKVQAPSARQREALERQTRWRRMAVAFVKAHASWSILQVATAVHLSVAGKKRGGPMRYSIGNIVKYIR